MSMIDKLKTFLNYQEGDDYYDDEELEQEEVNRPQQRTEQPRSSMKQPQSIKLEPIQKNVQKEAPHIVSEISQPTNLVNLQAAVQAKAAKVTLVEPRVYAEVKDIADQLRNRRSVIVNLHRVEHEQKKRIIDFLSGTVYALSGDIQRVGTDIYLCTPADVEVSGEISAMLTTEEF